MNRVETVWRLADTWERLALLALVVSAVAQTAFIFVYGARPWWRHRVGRALFTKSLSLLIVLWLSIVNTFLIYPAQQRVSTLALWLIAAAIVYQLVALLRTRRHVYPPDDRHDPVI